MIEFVQNNWGKISAISLAVVHAYALHRAIIKADLEQLVAFWREIGGLCGVCGFVVHGVATAQKPEAPGAHRTV